MSKHLAAARIEELLEKLGVLRCTRGSLITKVEANHFDMRAYHVATMSLAHEVMLLVVECVVLVLASVVLEAAGAYCCWRWCCRDTATRECQGSLPKHEGVSEKAIEIGVFSQAKADGSNPARRASHCAAATRLADKGVVDLIKRLMRGQCAQAMTEEAAAALLFVRRRLVSRPGGLALTDDAGATREFLRSARRSRSTTVDAGRSRT